MKTTLDRIYNNHFAFSGHVHAGNVVIVDGVARLLDIENFVLGVPSFYRPFFVQHSKIHTSEVIDVYSFGHLLYEMTFGYPLQESISRQAIECSPDNLSMFCRICAYLEDAKILKCPKLLNR